MEWFVRESKTRGTATEHNIRWIKFSTGDTEAAYISVQRSVYNFIINGTSTEHIGTTNGRNIVRIERNAILVQRLHQRLKQSYATHSSIELWYNNDRHTEKKMICQV